MLPQGRAKVIFFYEYQNFQILFCNSLKIYLLEINPQGPYLWPVKLKVYRAIAWWTLPVHFTLLILMIWGFSQIGIENPGLWACAVFILYSFLGRMIFSFHQRQGMRLLRLKKFEQALDQFRKSELYFKKYPWLDRFRFFFMLSASKLTFREMALLNQGYCLIMTGKLSEASLHFQNIRFEHPQNTVILPWLENLEQFLIEAKESEHHP